MNSAFSVIAQSLTRHAPSPLDHAAPDGGTTHTAQLLRLLDCYGPLTTAELAKGAGKPSRLVWGLLKGPRDSGHVSFDGHLWHLDRDWPGASVVRAVELLRGLGYKVMGPGEC